MSNTFNLFSAFEESVVPAFQFHQWLNDEICRSVLYSDAEGLTLETSALPFYLMVV